MIFINLILLLLIVNSIAFILNPKNVLGCGLVGFSGAEKFNPDAIKLLMALNEVRGRHSFGYYHPLCENETIKHTGLISSQLNKVLLKPDNLFIGHTRHATMGAHSTENQHPFVYDNIVGAHNGSLIDVDELASLYGINKSEYNIDSQLIYRIINKTQDINVAKDLKGAAALLFTDTLQNDSDNSNLFIIRNTERPLHCGKRPEGLYISSEMYPLEAIGCEDIKFFKSETLYQIHNGKIVYSQNVKMKTVVKNYNSYSSNSNNTSTKASDIVGKAIQMDFIPNSLKYYNLESAEEMTKDKFYLVLGCNDVLIDGRTTNCFSVVNNDKKIKWYPTNLFKSYTSKSNVKTVDCGDFIRLLDKYIIKETGTEFSPKEDYIVISQLSEIDENINCKNSEDLILEIAKASEYFEDGKLEDMITAFIPVTSLEIYDTEEEEELINRYLYENPTEDNDIDDLVSTYGNKLKNQLSTSMISDKTIDTISKNNKLVLNHLKEQI